MLNTGFYLLSFLLLVLLFAGMTSALKKSGLSAEQQRTTRLRAGAMLIGWFAYLAFMAQSGMLKEMTLPPRIPLFLVLPAFVFMGWYFGTGRHKLFIQNVPGWQPVTLQSFRVVVEFLIYGMFLEKILPQVVTFEGRNFDIVMGILAPLVAFMVFYWKMLPEKWAYYWNFLGLIVLGNTVAVFISLIVKPSVWGFEQSPISPEFGGLPYVLLPGFLMPLAVFLHVFSILQLRDRKK